MGGRLPLLEGGRKAAESCDVSLHERQRTGSCPLSQYICTQGSDSAGGCGISIVLWIGGGQYMIAFLVLAHAQWFVTLCVPMIVQ